MQIEFNKTTQGKHKTTYRDRSLFRRAQLENGITLVTEKIPHVRSASVGFWVQTGSRYENSNHNGISHLIEHMLFKGTSTRDAYEIAHSIENVGGILNAFTGKELTCYYAHVLDDDLPLAIDLLTDILTDSQFLQSELAKEKQVILEEIKDSNEIPEDKVHDYFFSDLFGSHSLALPVLGTDTSVTSINRDAALAHLQECYSCDRLVIAVAGNVEHDALCRMLDKRFLKLADSSRQVAEKPLKINSHIYKKYNESSLQSHICIGSLALPFNDDLKYAASLLTTLLGGGMSSRLFQEIREKHGLGYQIYAYLESFVDTGVFCIYAGTDKENELQAIDLIYAELEGVRRENIKPEELVSLKSQLKGNLMLGLEDTSSRMNRIAKMEIFLKNYYSLDDVIENIEKIRMEDIEAVAQKILDPEGFVTTILS